MKLLNTTLQPSGIMMLIHSLIEPVSNMPRKGPGVTVSGDNLVATWLDYRLDAKGMPRSEVITELNETLGKKYHNSRVYDWVLGKTSAPDAVLEIIDSELDAMVRWLFKSNDWPTKGVNLKKLTNALRPAIKLYE